MTLGQPLQYAPTNKIATTHAAANVLCRTRRHAAVVTIVIVVVVVIAVVVMTMRSRWCCGDTVPTRAAIIRTKRSRNTLTHHIDIIITVYTTRVRRRHARVNRVRSRTREYAPNVVTSYIHVRKSVGRRVAVRRGVRLARGRAAHSRWMSALTSKCPEARALGACWTRAPRGRAWLQQVPLYVITRRATRGVLPPPPPPPTVQSSYTLLSRCHRAVFRYGE